MTHKNLRCQFEFKTITNKNAIKEAYEWCLYNLPLTEGRGIQYWVTELFIITASQKVIDKINKHFGSNFSFDNPTFRDTRTFYLN